MRTCLKTDFKSHGGKKAKNIFTGELKAFVFSRIDVATNHNKKHLCKIMVRDSYF